MTVALAFTARRAIRWASLAITRRATPTLACEDRGDDSGTGAKASRCVAVPMLHEANVARLVAVSFVTLAHAVDVARTVAEALVRAAVAVARDAGPARWALAHAVDAFPAVRAVAGALEEEEKKR